MLAIANQGDSIAGARDWLIWPRGAETLIANIRNFPTPNTWRQRATWLLVPAAPAVPSQVKNF
jgi:hypothetical protein